VHLLFQPWVLEQPVALCSDHRLLMVVRVVLAT
jgi:hypothetical protein